MNWKLANRAQLCEIAYSDNEAPLKHRIAAADELKHRNRKIPNILTQYKRKAVYPR